MTRWGKTRTRTGQTERSFQFLCPNILKLNPERHLLSWPCSPCVSFRVRTVTDNWVHRTQRRTTEEQRTEQSFRDEFAVLLLLELRNTFTNNCPLTDWTHNTTHLFPEMNRQTLSEERSYIQKTNPPHAKPPTLSYQQKQQFRKQATRPKGMASQNMLRHQKLKASQRPKLRTAVRLGLYEAASSRVFLFSQAHRLERHPLRIKCHASMDNHLEGKAFLRDGRRRLQAEGHQTGAPESREQTCTCHHRGTPVDLLAISYTWQSYIS